MRCPWPGTDELMIHYHDTEWGVPVHDDQKHFEFLILDANQAGLSWRTILYKRSNFERAFAGFDVQKVAQFTEADIERLMQDAGIIRNRLKITAALINARQFIEIQQEFGSFDNFIWGFVDDRPINATRQENGDVPATSPEAIAMSKELLRRGFKFVGPTICYAYMQAAGLVNDHLASCFRHSELVSAR